MPRCKDHRHALSHRNLPCKFYREQGYGYAPLRAISTAEAAELRRRLETYEADAGPIAGPLRQKSHLLFTSLNVS